MAEFESAYNDTGSTVITSITCSGRTFVYDGAEEDFMGNEGFTAYAWKDGEGRVYTEGLELREGDSAWYLLIEDGEVVDSEVYKITSVGADLTEGTYMEPWVSVVERKTITSNGGWKYEYVGEVDVYEGMLA